jgi:hypothetical protein
MVTLCFVFLDVKLKGWYKVRGIVLMVYMMNGKFPLHIKAIQHALLHCPFQV